jgi:hypothetical protein
MHTRRPTKWLLEEPDERAGVAGEGFRERSRVALAVI